MKKKITPPVVKVEEPKVEAKEIKTKNEDVIAFKRSHFYSVMVAVAFLAGILTGYFVWGRDGDSGGSAAVSNAQAPTAPAFRRYDVPTDGFHSLGPADAPITIVEFSDFQCPYCQRWREQVFDPLLAAYPGQIRIVYRNLPLTSIHPQAMPAAEAAMCAGEQNVFWEFHDKLYENQASLGSDLYSQLASGLGLKMETFEACLADHKYQEAIKADMNFALGLGVNSTPTFFINGIAVVGAQPLTSFTQVIDKELAGGFPE